jgi:hypothetical protein
MPNPNDKNQGATPPTGTAGTTPPAPGAADNAAAQNTGAAQGTTPGVTPLDNGSGNKPPAAPPAPLPPAQETKQRVKCIALKGKKLAVGKDVIPIGEDGIFEVGKDQAKRLLTIPGYTPA